MGIHSALMSRATKVVPPRASHRVQCAANEQPVPTSRKACSSASMCSGKKRRSRATTEAATSSTPLQPVGARGMQCEGHALAALGQTRQERVGQCGGLLMNTFGRVLPGRKVHSLPQPTNGTVRNSDKRSPVGAVVGLQVHNGRHLYPRPALARLLLVRVALGLVEQLLHVREPGLGWGGGQCSMGGCFIPCYLAGEQWQHGSNMPLRTCTLACQSCLNPSQSSVVPPPEADATGDGLAGVSAQKESVRVGHHAQAQQQLCLCEVLCSATGCEQSRM